jgi:transcriptional regulator with XRE-family HTH domain
MNENETYSDLSQFLVGCVRSLKKRYPHFSDLELSRRLGLSNSTFSRLKNNDNKQPTFTNALKLVRAVCEEGEVHEFIKKFYPEMLSNFRRVYPGNSNIPFVKAEAETFFEDPTTYEIMVMATSGTGLTRDRIAREFGNKGLLIAEKLVENEVLQEKDGHIGLLGTINATQGTVHKLLQNLVRLSYDLDSFGNGKDNWLSVQYDSVNMEVVMPKLREVMVNANQQIREILNDPSSKGSDVLWAGLVMDSLIKSKDKKGNEVLQ